MLKKYSSALLAVAIGTMMSTTEAVKIQEDTGLVDPYEVASDVFEVADQDDNDVVTEQELGNAMKKLLQSFEIALEKTKELNDRSGEEEGEVEGLRCFIDPFYSEDQIKSWSDIEYGRAWNGKTGSEQDLMFDVYAPDPEVDHRARKPVVVLMHAYDFNSEHGGK